MTTVRKFMFDRDFGPPREKKPAAAEKREAPPPPPPTFSEEELNLARDQAYEEGRQAGLAEAGAATEKALADAFAAMAKQMKTLRAAQSESAERNARDAVTIAMAVARKMLPTLTERQALDEVAAVVAKCIAECIEEPRLVIRVAPELEQPVRERAETAAAEAGFEGKLVIKADGKMQRSDCRVEWSDGGAERDQRRLMEEIDAVVAAAVNDPARATADNGVD